MSFLDFKLKQPVQDFISAIGFQVPTPVQTAVIPQMLKGEDLMVVSATGSGKTHAFLIPILERIDVKKAQVQAVITAPTRELATQTYQFALLAKEFFPELTIKLITGGLDADRLKLGSTQPQLVIGTPGKLNDLFLKQQVLRLDSAEILVIDEADMMLDLGFLTEIDQLAGKMPADLQLLVFSATIPLEIKQFLQKYQRNPQQIELSAVKIHQEYIEHTLIPIKHRSFGEALIGILPGFQPYVCLIFANTRVEASDVHRHLLTQGIKALEIHGGLTSRQRQQALKELQNHTYVYVVATDMAARGLDIAGVTHVVSLGFPSDLDFYWHRSGRTGRNQKSGYSLVLYRPSDLPAALKLTKQGIEFQHRELKAGKWVDLKPLEYRHTFKKEPDKDIARILNRKNVKVKPGYKRQQKAEIEKIKRQKRREIIQASIREQKKTRAKQKQIAKRGES